MTAADAFDLVDLVRLERATSSGCSTSSGHTPSAPVGQPTRGWARARVSRSSRSPPQAGGTPTLGRVVVEPEPFW